MATTEFIKNVIQYLSGKIEFGLGSDSETSAQNRILNTDFLPDGSMSVQVASDGMTLDQKINLERELSSVWHQAHPHQKLHVYFKRLEKNNTQEKRLPGSVNKPAPFGLKVQKRAIPHVNSVIVIASGKGGVGKSTVSTNLAVTLARLGYKVGLFDADVYGPSSPTMLGLRGQLDVNADRKIEPRAAFGVKTVSFGFMTDSYNPVIWRGPMVAKAIEQFCYDVNWGELDYLIVDLPPGTGDVQMSLIENLPIHGAVIVTTPQDVALIDAHKALSMFEKLEVPVIGLVENMTGFICPHCGETSHIFGEHGATEFAEIRNLKTLGKIPLQASIRIGSDAGKPCALIAGSIEERIFSNIATTIANFSS